MRKPTFWIIQQVYLVLLSASVWRQHGLEAARSILAQLVPQELKASGLLVQELRWRLQGHAGHRLLVDGVSSADPMAA